MTSGDSQHDLVALFDPADYTTPPAADVSPDARGALDVLAVREFDATNDRHLFTGDDGLAAGGVLEAAAPDTHTLTNGMRRHL